MGFGVWGLNPKNLTTSTLNHTPPPHKTSKASAPTHLWPSAPRFLGAARQPFGALMGAGVLGGSRLFVVVGFFWGRGGFCKLGVFRSGV